MSKFTFRYLQIRNLYYCTYIETFIQITQPCCYVSPDSQSTEHLLTHTYLHTYTCAQKPHIKISITSPLNVASPNAAIHQQPPIPLPHETPTQPSEGKPQPLKVNKQCPLSQGAVLSNTSLVHPSSLIPAPPPPPNSRPSKGTQRTDPPHKRHSSRQ